jgi:hypothetical protein
MFNEDLVRTDVANLERPGVGFGTQVLVQRTLNGRWALSSGVGYHEYATELNLKVYSLVRTAPPVVNTYVPPRVDTIVSTVRLRDTYRFLTLPVRFSYQLGPATRRFTYGLTGGADLAWYVGGASTETSACACESQAWGASGSPYRPFSLSMSLGLDVRYRVGSRWDLLAQPTATYFATPLAGSNPRYYPRHLLGAGVLLGLSYSLP